MSRPPILFYCQHLLGLGHVQRGALLARALVKAGERVLFVAGGLPVPGLDLGGAEEIPLPPLTAADEAASTLALPDGTLPDQRYLADRQARLLALLSRYDPAVVLLELFPFGRHALSFELVPLLLALTDDRRRRRGAAPRVAVSLRDLVVSKKNQPWYEATVLAVVRQWVDRVLVHGSPDVIPLSRTFGLADRLGDTLLYTGYLCASPTRLSRATPRGEVVVSGGGGRVAGPLFRTALAARPMCPASAALPWRLLTGPYLPDALRAELETLAAGLGPVAGRPAVVLETFRDDFPGLLQGAALSVSQAGYNTVLDVVASGVRAVVVPYEGSGDEQPVRARILAERGLLKVVAESELSPARLAAAIQDALTAPGFPAPARLDLNGASRSAEIVKSLVEEVIAARQVRRVGPRAGGRPHSARRRYT
ncbi:MAG: glycosyl transferase [candidate division NC10 bacterium]|nr:glycosyl transferase [candidate division NC10 bacterium]